jgi:hypothetical protein
METLSSEVDGGELIAGANIRCSAEEGAADGVERGWIDVDEETLVDGARLG